MPGCEDTVVKVSDPRPQGALCVNTGRGEAWTEMKKQDKCIDRSKDKDQGHYMRGMEPWPWKSWETFNIQI